MVVVCGGSGDGGVSLPTVSPVLNSSQASQDLFEERASGWQGRTDGRTQLELCVSTH